MKSIVKILALVVFSPIAFAQQPDAGQGSSIAKPSVYAVNAAGLSAAMTYCIGRYQNINQGSKGADCFARTRNLLAEMKLSTWSAGIDQKCTDAVTYNRCMTPEIGRLVYALNDAFKSREF